MTPADAFKLAQHWADETMPEIHRRRNHWHWETGTENQATLTREDEKVMVSLRPFDPMSDDPSDPGWIIRRTDHDSGVTRVLHCTGIDQVEPTLANDDALTGAERKEQKDRALRGMELKKQAYAKNAGIQIKGKTPAPAA